MTKRMHHKFDSVIYNSQTQGYIRTRMLLQLGLRCGAHMCMYDGG